MMILTQQIEQVRSHLDLLHGRSKGRPVDELAEEALAELSVALEEMEVADDELRRQNEQLAHALRMVEGERRRYWELFNAAPDGYIVTDMNGTIREANLAATAMLRISGDFLMGKPLVSFVAEADRREFRRSLIRAERGDGLIALEMHLQPREGNILDVEARAVVVHDALRSQAGLRWIIRDVTERKMIEDQVRELNMELEKRVEERTAQLAEAMRGKEDLLTMEQTARQAAERARNRLLLLAQASERLGSSLDYETTLSSVARLLVNHLADSCLIFLTDGESRVRQAASAHLDPRKEPLLSDLAERNCFGIGDEESTVARVIRDGIPFIENMAEDGEGV